MKTIQQLPFAVLGAGAAFTILWGVADPVSAYAEVRTYTGVGTCALGDIGTPEQAKNLAREKALQNAKEQAGVYLANYTKATNTHLAANEITTITNNIINLVGEVQYQKTPSEANGQPVIVYTATLQANVDTDGIQDWLSRDEKQRNTVIVQTEASQAEIRSSIEQLDRITAQYNQAGSEQEKEQLKKEYNEADKRLIAAQKDSEGVELYFKGDYDGAIRLFRESIALDPNSALPWSFLGAAYWDLNMQKDDPDTVDLALECSKKAVELDPHDVAAWFTIQNMYGVCGKQDERQAMEWRCKALTALRDMEDTTEGMLELRNLMWSEFYFMKFYQIEDQEVIDVLNRYPYLKSYDNYWDCMGVLYNRMGNYDKAIESCREGIARNPEFRGVFGYYWDTMGKAYQHQGNYNTAIDYFRKTIELDSEFASPWKNMGISYYQMGNYAKAVECFQRALELNPDYEAAKEGLALAQANL